MIPIAAATLRNRWVSFIGALVAVVTGTALLTSMGLLFCALLYKPAWPAERFVRAETVVYAADPAWNPAHHDLGTRSLTGAEGLSAGLVAKLQQAGSVTVDRTLYAQIVGAHYASSSAPVGHGWSSAALAGYVLRNGRPPQTAAEIVVAGTQARLGQIVRVMTANETRRYTVVGIVQPLAFEQPVFFQDTEAARLMPRIDAAALNVAPNRVQGIVGTAAEVLSGPAKHQADESYAVNSKAYEETFILLPIMATVTAFVAVFVVASTFAFTVAQRRQEIALLHTIGATRRQLTHMIMGEAAVLGSIGAAIGCAGSNWLAPYLASRLVAEGVAPDWFSVAHILPWLRMGTLGVAMVCGLTVSLAGAWSASRRVGTIPASDALHEAAVDTGVMSRSRQWIGVASLATVVGTLAWVGWMSPAIVQKPTDYIPLLLVPVLTAAILAPVVIPPLSKALLYPFARLKGATAMLLRESILTNVRRTASITIPILLTLSIITSLSVATATPAVTKLLQTKPPIASDYLLLPQQAPGINRAAVQALAPVPGIAFVAPIPTTIYVQSDGGLDENDAFFVNPKTFRAAATLSVISGSLDQLNAHTMAVPDLWHYDLGEQLDVYFGDGTHQRLTVAAIIKATRGTDAAYLSDQYAPSALYTRNGLVNQIYAQINPGADRSAATSNLRQFAQRNQLRLTTISQQTTQTRQAEVSTIAVRQSIVTQLILLFCFIALTNTLIMATADRTRSFQTLRLAGATPSQVVFVAAAEAVTVFILGLLLAAAATVINILGLWLALSQLYPAASFAVDWILLGKVAAGDLIITLAATALASMFAIRWHRP